MMDKLKIEGDELIKWLSDESVSKGAEWIKVNLYRYWYCGYRGIKFESYSKKYEEGEFNQLDYWMTKQIIDSYPLELVSPVNWSDETQNINDRVRSYLDVNCGHCHSPTGNANSTGLYLHLDETRDIHLGIYKKPVATGRGSGGLKYSIVPGKPEESILLHRMISLDPGVMMPESGRALSHHEAVEMVREWILLLKE